jgi:mono/diheme cytochrome c family protein
MNLFLIPKTMLSASLSFAAAIVISAIPAHAQASAAKSPAAHAGQQIFTQRCFQCHSVIPDQVRFGPSLFGVVSKPHPRKTDAEVRTILKNGKGKMPSFDGVLTKEDTDNLLAYLHSL